jgi:kynureninase
MNTDPAGTQSEQAAKQRDRDDELPTLRDQFHIPPHPGASGAEVAYFAGNSLGLQPKVTQGRLLSELEDWATLGVDGHLDGRRSWLSYHELLREPSARLIGAHPHETVAMNSLTVNLHLMMISFYRPTAERHAIVIEDTAFPSDSYAVRSQAALHGYDPDSAVIRLRPREGESALRSEDIVSFLHSEGHRVALVLLGGVNYFSGEFLDIGAITRAAQTVGAVMGWDLAHAAGNLPLRMHDWNVDWAAWCSYKYLNGGPGAIAGAFVHERHLADPSLPKLAGWWSSNPETRFRMAATVDQVDSADSWQLSNPPILAMAPVLASLEIFDAVGMDALRAKSIRLTGYLESLLDNVCRGRPLQVLTPRDPHRRGAQLSVRIDGIPATKVSEWLRFEHGVIADARQPDVIRLAPVPLYCTYHDCWRAASALARVVDDHGL